MIKIDHEEIWYWYLQLEKQKASGIGRKPYADLHKLDYKRLCNMHYRLVYKSQTYPEDYAKFMALAKQFKESGIPMGEYCQKYRIERRMLEDMVTHLGYLDIVEKMRSSKGIPAIPKPEMKFLQVPMIQTTQSQHPISESTPSEVITKQNDIEIIITKGVKVHISPELDSMKIIRIIELLKDL